ncbi:hypothetical protein DN402_04310 [Streptomyces sp. SW4]|nr:hypothetical protein DN402_04310 [Streptomyces sp. SW4]
MVYEGFAHNPHENTTMLYFTPGDRVARMRRRFPRWELQCAGDLSAVARARPVREAEVERSYAALRANSASAALRPLTSAAAATPDTAREAVAARV